MNAQATEITALRQALAYAIQEVDDWHDECHGGPVVGDAVLDAARQLLATPSVAEPMAWEDTTGIYFSPITDTYYRSLTPALQKYYHPIPTATPAPTVITEEQAHAMGAKGAPPTEAERLLFEAWMHGHCWAYPDTWNGVTYMDTAPWVAAKMPDPYAMQTRKLWAAWRDRAALAG